jgi:hypothetical protein
MHLTEPQLAIIRAWERSDIDLAISADTGHYVALVEEWERYLTDALGPTVHIRDFLRNEAIRIACDECSLPILFDRVGLLDTVPGRRLRSAPFPIPRETHRDETERERAIDPQEDRTGLEAHSHRRFDENRKSSYRPRLYRNALSDWNGNRPHVAHHRKGSVRPPRPARRGDVRHGALRRLPGGLKPGLSGHLCEDCLRYCSGYEH